MPTPTPTPTSASFATPALSAPAPPRTRPPAHDAVARGERRECRSAASVIVVLAVWLVWLTGCSKIPEGRMAVQRVDVVGETAGIEGDAQGKIATAASPKFLMLFPGVVYDYELFDRFVLQRDLERIERYYRARGYYEAEVRAARVETVDERKVRVTIAVRAGEPVRVRAIAFRGLESLPAAVRSAAESAVRNALDENAILDEEAFALAEENGRAALTDRGYAYARAERNAQVFAPEHRADLTYTFSPGPVARFGSIRIEGLGELPEAPVRRALDLHEGDVYSTAELRSAQQAVLNLGLFSSATIDPVLSPEPSDSPIVPLLVRVETTKLRHLSLGVGTQFDAIRLDVHGTAMWESRNFLGGMRNLRLRFRPSLVFYPTRIGQGGLVAPTDYLPEQRTSAEFRQPGFLEARTNGTLEAEVNNYAFLLSANVPPPDAPILGYHEFIGRPGLDRMFGPLFVKPVYNIQTAYPFYYARAPETPIVENITISYVGLFTSLDLRNDAIKPRRGLFLSNEIQFAGGPFFGDTDDIRVQPEVRGYIPLSKRFVLAGRTSVGFLFPRNYGGTLNRPEGDPSVTPAERTRDLQRLFFRSFFSGGPNSNRGYPLRGIGPHGFVPFLVPAAAEAQFATGCREDANTASTDPNCLQPLGGLSLWEASLELRFAITGPLSGAVFCDASDVSASRVDLRFNRPHVSCGAGGRVDTPVGPIRLDVGYRIPGLQTLVPDEPRSVGVPPTLFGIPIAVSFGIGEAY